MLKKKYKKRALVALMIAILLLAFTGTVAVSTQVVQAEQTEAGTEAETVQDIINPDESTGVTKILLNVISDIANALTTGLSRVLNFLIGDVTDIILQTGNGVTKFYCFSFEKGNVYGVIAAIAYSLMRGIAFLALAVQLIYAIVQAIVGVSTGVRAAQLKASIGTIATSFFVLALAPMLMTQALNIRNQVTGLIIAEIYGRNNTDFGQAILSACQGAPILGGLAYGAFFFFCIRMAIDYANVALSCVVCMMSLPLCCMLGPQSTKSRLANWLTIMTSNLLVPIIDALLLSIPCLILQVDVSITQQLGRVFCMIVSCLGIQPARTWIAQAIGVSESGALRAGGQFARGAQEAWRDAKKKASDFGQKLDDAKEQDQKADAQEALAAATQGATSDALSNQNTDNFDGAENAGTGGLNETTEEQNTDIQNADDQNTEVAPEVGNMPDNQVNDDATDKAAETDEPEVTGQENGVESADKAAEDSKTADESANEQTAGIETSGQKEASDKSATTAEQGAESSATTDATESTATDTEVGGQATEQAAEQQTEEAEITEQSADETATTSENSEQSEESSATTDAAESTAADTETSEQAAEQAAEQQTEEAETTEQSADETATTSESSEQGEESSATTDATESTATDTEAGGQATEQTAGQQADQSANPAQNAEKHKASGSVAESKKSAGKSTKKKITVVDTESDAQDQDTDKSAGTDTAENAKQPIDTNTAGDSKTSTTESGTPDSGQAVEGSTAEGTASQESGGSSNTDTQQNEAYDGFTAAGIGALPQDESGLVAMQGNLEQQEQQARNDIALMKRSRRRFNRTKQSLQQQKATNDSEYRIREAGLQSQIAEANLAEEKAKAKCLAQGGKPNNDPDVQAYRQTSKSLSEDLKNLQTNHQLANASFDKQIQTIDSQISACEGAIEDTSEQVAQIQDAKAQVQDARRVISQATGQHYQASAAAASVQIAQNQALASRATLDNFEQPQIYAALSPEQRADFHRQKAKDIRKTARGQLVGGIGGAIAGAAAGSMAGGVQGSILMGQMGSDIGGAVGGKIGPVAAGFGAAAVAGPFGTAVGIAAAAGPFGPAGIAAATRPIKTMSTQVGPMWNNIIQQEIAKPFKKIPLNPVTSGTTNAGNTSIVQGNASAPQPMHQQPMSSQPIIRQPGSHYQSRASQFSNYTQPIVRNSTMLTPQDRQQYFEQQKDNFNKYYANYKEDYMNTSGNGPAPTPQRPQQPPQQRLGLDKPIKKCLNFCDFNGTFDPTSHDDPRKNKTFNKSIKTLATTLKDKGIKIGAYNPNDKNSSAETAAEKILRNAPALDKLLDANDKKALRENPLKASKEIAERLFNDPNNLNPDLVGIGKLFTTVDASVGKAVLEKRTQEFKDDTARILQMIDFAKTKDSNKK